MSPKPLICATGVSGRDAQLATLWIRWTSFLAEQKGGSNRLANHLVVLAMSVTPEQEADLRAAVGPWKGNAFRTVFVRLVDEIENAYPKSASHLFLRTLEAAEKLFPGSPVLWCEADTVALRPGWFAEIEAAYERCGRPFLGAKCGTQHPHLCGNAVYPANWRELAPSIANVLSAPDYKLWGPGKGQPWDVWCRNETTPQMAESKLWHHIWRERDARATRLKDIPAAACLFHQDKTGALIREIATARYPEFMALTNTGRRFYLLNGHPSRLLAKGVKIVFPYKKWSPGGWRSLVCSDEISDDHASALATLAGRFGLREVAEDEYLKMTGRKQSDLPPLKVRVAPPAPSVDEKYTHPSVFVMLGRYGDICNVLPMLKAEADAGRRPTLVVSQDFADILDGVSYVDRLVWDGAYDRLADALRWLRRDKGIAAPVVCQYHRNPLDKARLTPSYQSECWRLAGRLDQFATRGPLVFDQRDIRRETELATRVLGELTHPRLPTILVGLESASSPLENANEILHALVERLGDSHEVVNLSSIKAERVYDLIGLFDEAALLIASDTVHIHLARASKVPLIALLNDNWRGSVVEHAKQTVRYAVASPTEVVTRAEQEVCKDSLTTMVYPRIGLTPAQIEQAFASATAPTRAALIERAAAAIKDVSPFSAVAEKMLPRPMSALKPEDLMPANRRVFHVVDAYGSDTRHHVAQATWTAAYQDGMTPVHVHEHARNARRELGDRRPLPFLKDILKAGLDASSHDDDVICWTNSDIGLKAGAAAAIGDHVRRHGAASMRRTESNGKGHPGRDLFAFTAKWLREHWAELPDYVIGAPVFDLGLVAMIRKFHGLPFSLTSCNSDLMPADMAPGYALHQSHDPEWEVDNMDAVPSVRWNKEQFRAWAKRYAPKVKFTKRGNLI